MENRLEIVGDKILTSSDLEEMNIEEAKRWWNSISFEDKIFNVIEWLKSQNRNTTERRPCRLTNIEILQIYNLIILNK